MNLQQTKNNPSWIARFSVWAILILIIAYEIFFGISLYRQLSAGASGGLVKHVQLINQPALQKAVQRYSAAGSYTPSSGAGMGDPFANPVSIGK